MATIESLEKAAKAAQATVDKLYSAEEKARLAFEDAARARREAAQAAIAARRAVSDAIDAERLAAIPTTYRVDVVDRGYTAPVRATKRNLLPADAEAYAAFLRLGLGDGEDVLVRVEEKN